uniref:Uncharacterized protein n=1 Tax=Sexangularia sp. CB-2014 TaxID=1486929 RepID=A0A7S1YDF3_9EUKA|mmetsp:Transcript_14656/g.46003  ORF Transcript_14656/g.46003 Transcript_14656/m.46003 type:complete len:242 (+) Transcript_14656:76-801(+)
MDTFEIDSFSCADEYYAQREGGAILRYTGMAEPDRATIVDWLAWCQPPPHVSTSHASPTHVVSVGSGPALSEWLLASAAEQANIPLHVWAVDVINESSDLILPQARKAASSSPATLHLVCLAGGAAERGDWSGPLDCLIMSWPLPPMPWRAWLHHTVQRATRTLIYMGDWTDGDYCVPSPADFEQAAHELGFDRRVDRRLDDRRSFYRIYTRRVEQQLSVNERPPPTVHVTQVGTDDCIDA